MFHTHEPLVRSLECVPPPASHLDTGGPETYYLPATYTPRTKEIYYNDISATDEWQREVYQLGRMFADRHGLHSVCDVGCGSAFKLMREFDKYEKTGVDVPETVSWLRRKYPHATWVTEELDQPSKVRADLVICSDVIEHVSEPNRLLAYLASIEPQLIVLSTPDRNLLLNGNHSGPPANPHHIREWSYLEFHRYISDHFDVLEHFYSNPFQGTQMVVARPR